MYDEDLLVFHEHCSYDWTDNYENYNASRVAYCNALDRQTDL